jgi:hypothetical protein
MLNITNRIQNNYCALSSGRCLNTTSGCELNILPPYLFFYVIHQLKEEKRIRKVGLLTKSIDDMVTLYNENRSLVLTLYTMH